VVSLYVERRQEPFAVHAESAQRVAAYAYWVWASRFNERESYFTTRKPYPALSHACAAAGSADRLFNGRCARRAFGPFVQS
jgi:hypothetical protein